MRFVNEAAGGPVDVSFAIYEVTEVEVVTA